MYNMSGIGSYDSCLCMSRGQGKVCDSYESQWDQETSNSQRQSTELCQQLYVSLLSAVSIDDRVHIHLCAMFSQNYYSSVSPLFIIIGIFYLFLKHCSQVD